MTPTKEYAVAAETRRPLPTSSGNAKNIHSSQKFVLQSTRPCTAVTQTRREAVRLRGGPHSSRCFNHKCLDQCSSCNRARFVVVTTQYGGHAGQASGTATGCFRQQITSRLSLSSGQSSEICAKGLNNKLYSSHRGPSQHPPWLP